MAKGYLRLISLLIAFSIACADYRIGVGIADCTGPSVEIVFMGYAKVTQKGCGIHLRQFSRAFIFDDGAKRASFVSVDSAMMTHGVRRAVLHRLRGLYNDTYTEENLILSGTHTHGTPGGFVMDLMYDIPSFGFSRETFDALVSGVTKSIVNAHENMVEGKMFLTSGELLQANINRSPTAYLLNPEEERAKYTYDVDKEMVQLKLVRSSDNTPIGVISWFAVHPTSMNNTNCLVSSDNVGYASVLLEKMINKNLPIGQGQFVGAFASTNLGDVSPNLKGARCIDSGEKCEMSSSTCNGKSQNCIASGPGKDMFDSTRIISGRLFGKAKDLMEDSGSVEVTGPIKFIHQYVDMPNKTATITLANGTETKVHGCLPAMGYSFAAGTTDGPGEFDFHQGTVNSNPLWNNIRDFIFPPTKDDIACQHPKPILINSGRISTPYEWQPRIVSTQLVKLGDVVLIGVPGEFTTMSGRRLRTAVKEAFASNGGSENTTPIIAGLSNTYTSYIATPEEYQMQRYEGASTIYGPHTLTLYLNVYTQLAKALVKDERVNAGPTPPDFSRKLISFIPKVYFDTAGFRKFGRCIAQPPPQVNRGDIVEAKFVAGNPRNNVMHGQTFLAIEKLNDSGDWTVVATDADWETKFIWKRTSFWLGKSEVTIQWEIGEDVPIGTYRIRHFGHNKSVFGGVHPYEGASDSFQVV